MIHRSLERTGRTYYAQFPAPLELCVTARILRPRHVVESGVSSGISTAHLLLALERNGRRARSPPRTALRRFIAEVRKVGTAEVLSHRSRDRLDGIRSLGAVPVHLFEGLTERQIHILVTAIEGGLLEFPARVKRDRVAARQGLSRFAFGELLRKVETQVLRNSYPFLKLLDQIAGPKATAPSRGSRRIPNAPS